jgi:hypothetical protein
VPHLRLGKGRIRLLPEHVDALVALFTVESRPPDAEPSTSAPVDLVALGSMAKPLTAHRRHPLVQGDGQLF